MNEHLSPIFETVLPAIRKAGISYWVYGGVAIAGIKGKFIRHNRDADIFVFDSDYERTTNLIAGISKEMNWSYKDARLLNQKRPKREFFVSGTKDDLLSVIPVYPSNGQVMLIYPTPLIPKSALTEENRAVDGHVFITPSIAFLRELFIYNLSSRRRLSSKRRVEYGRDAEVILTDSEREKYFAPHTQEP